MILRGLIESTLPDNTEVVWEGFVNELGTLRKRGWLVQELPKFDNWKQPRNSESSHRYLYIRDPLSKMIGRAVIGDNHNEVLVLEFLSQECNGRVHPPKVFLEQNLTAEDIPALLDLVTSIQESQPKKRKYRTDIIELKKVANRGHNRF